MRKTGISENLAASFAVLQRLCGRCVVRTLLADPGGRAAVRRMVAEVGSAGARSIPEGPLRDAIDGIAEQLDWLCQRSREELEAIERGEISYDRLGRAPRHD